MKYLLKHHQIKSNLEFCVMLKECYGNRFRVVANIWFGQIGMQKKGMIKKLIQILDEKYFLILNISALMIE